MAAPSRLWRREAAACCASSGRRVPGASRDLDKLIICSSGYILARMPFAIMLSPEAVEDLRRLRSNVRAEVRQAIEVHLRREPRKASRSRIKRLRGVSRPQFRLSVGEVRVFYDVTGD